MKYVADQLRDTEEISGRMSPERTSPRRPCGRQLPTAEKQLPIISRQLMLRKDHDPVTTLTNELYAIFMCHLLAGSEASVKYTEMLLRRCEKSTKRRRTSCALDAHYAVSSGSR